jgi:hypothetical protein
MVHCCSVHPPVEEHSCQLACNHRPRRSRWPEERDAHSIRGEVDKGHHAERLPHIALGTAQDSHLEQERVDEDKQDRNGKDAEQNGRARITSADDDSDEGLRKERYEQWQWQRQSHHEVKGPFSQPIPAIRVRSHVVGQQCACEEGRRRHEECGCLISDAVDRECPGSFHEEEQE